MDVRTCSITASAFLANATSAMAPQPNCSASTFLALAVSKNRPSASRFSKSGVGRGMRKVLSLQGNFWRVNTIETAVEPAPKSGCASAAFFDMTCFKTRRTFAKFFRVSASAMTSSGENFPLLPPADCQGSGQRGVRGIVRLKPKMPCAPSNSRPAFGRAPTNASAIATSINHALGGHIAIGSAGELAHPAGERAREAAARTQRAGAGGGWRCGGDEA
mmetsp:Transcript_6515/g.16182  ORF Transcript_6515/g.16182 Transcript_6515/m.16182 type:complete len:218 (+) Transcript_6515:283-936(+)